MPKFYNNDIADLAHQLTLSPRRLRVAQLDGIEKLLSLIDPKRAYPFELVCYTVTGFRKRGTSAGASVPGAALIGDLVTMAELVSRKAALSVRELGQPYQTHQELAAELKVSTKTIHRWRSRGLMGIRAAFEDGVSRLVFARRTIQRFVEQNKSLVSKGAAFRQLTGVERNHLVERARALLSKRSLKLHVVARSVAEETGRAVETVRYTLRRYDESHPETPLFSGRATSAYDQRRRSVWRCHRAGESTASIARAFDTTAAEVERVVRGVQVEAWRESPFECVPNELFDAPDADDIILKAPEPPGRTVDSTCRVPKDVPAYLRSLYLTPLLTSDQERDLFRRYNYVKYKAARCVEAIDVDEVSPGEFEAIRGLAAQTDALRQRIIRANLRLVVSIAKKHVGWSPRFFEVVSDGNMSLMRAVEKFDFARGNKFSTYATWAIMKNYARSIPEQYYHCSRFVTGQEAVLDNAAAAAVEPVPQSDRQRVRGLIAEGLRTLTDREREIVAGHFGLARTEGSLTLEQLGRRFGVTKERIRQIEQRALARLREVLAPNLIEAISE